MTIIPLSLAMGIFIILTLLNDFVNIQKAQKLISHLVWWNACERMNNIPTLWWCFLGCLNYFLLIPFFCVCALINITNQLTSIVTCSTVTRNVSNQTRVSRTIFKTIMIAYMYFLQLLEFHTQGMQSIILNIVDGLLIVLT